MSEFKFREPRLPKRIYKKYRFLSCLKSKKEAKVYVLEGLDDGKRYVLKIAKGRHRKFLANEYDILTEYDFKFFPKVYEFFNTKKKSCLIREYVEGQTLSYFVEENSPYSVAEAEELISKIGACIEKMHSQTPPLIHRDIKPQNILVTDAGEIYFIDADTMRSYKAESTEDTVYAASVGTAAPEQYGFGQSDRRTDVYSLGVLLLYLLTGKYTPYCDEYQSIPGQLKSVIRKALSFDPHDRYRSVAVMRRDVGCVRKTKLRRKSLIGILTAVLCICVVTGFAVHRQVKLYHYEHDSYAFANPLVEEAARANLSVGELDTLTEEDLADVKTICICNGTIFTDILEHKMYHDDNWFEFGEALLVSEKMDLSDLKHMTGLETLILDNCGVEDLKDISELPIETLGLRKNQVTDISPISQMTSLKELILDENPIEDISALSGCTRLNSLQIQNAAITDLSAIRNLPLTRLDFVGSPIEDYSGVLGLKNLSSFYATNLAADDINAISELTNIQYLGIYGCEIDDLEKLHNLKNLVSCDFTDSKGVKDLNWVRNHPMLDYLGICRTEVTDLSPLTECDLLTHLDINGVKVDDLSPIKDIRLLGTLYIDSAKENAVRALGLPDTVEVIVVD